MNKKRRFASIVIFTFCYGWLLGQTATISGLVTDLESNQPVEVVTIYVEGTNNAVESDADGRYSIQVPANEDFVLLFSRIGYSEQNFRYESLQAGSRLILNVQLKSDGPNLEIEVTEQRIEEAAIIREEVEGLKLLPTTTGNFESVLPHIALGTSSGSGGELTSQYNVRGGNYDENLVYVNDFEIYRPQLIRSGQQEGLSFPNIDLIRDLQFSSGGFAAKYGDKLSSVLDIKYKRPDSTKASIGLSFLGGSAHIEGAKQVGLSKYRKFRYLLGARYKTTQYLLGSLQLEGEYQPNFADVQGYFTFDINRNWQLGYLTNFNYSQYNFVPQERSTATGLIDFALRLFATFEGGENDEFTTTMNGLSATYIPERDKNPLYLKFLASHQSSNEIESFDIRGAYRLSIIETNFGSDEAGEDVLVIGTGIQHQYTRNFLRSNIFNIQHRGGLELAQGNRTHFIQWGARFQYENIFDKINEWERLDSAGYSLPYSQQEVLVQSNIKSQNELISNRYQIFFQDNFTKNTDRYEMIISAGIRANYWSLNNELLISPRAHLLYKPLTWKRDMSFKIASGLYQQPPFYRELRRLTGIVNTDALAQKSAHFVAGWTYEFDWGKKNPVHLKLISELYFKYMWDLITFDIENVRIRYSGENDADGYAVGLDLRLNGEFVRGAESWINLSLLRTRESILGVQHRIREIGDLEGRDVADVPRPTDQAVQLALFFQDYLPKNENFKVHVNFTFGTGLPFGLLGNNIQYRNTYRYRPYHRVDMGFSFLLWNKSWRNRKPNNLLRFTDNAWLSIEAFNLMGVLNVANNTWVKDIYGVQYAIPNFLTSRRINLRLKFDF